MRLFTHQRRAGSESPDTADAPDPNPRPDDDDRSSTRPSSADRSSRAVAHLRQDNGELAEDVVQTAVVDSTAIEEVGGVADVELGGDDGDRILWVAPIPKEGDVPVEPTGRARRLDPDGDLDDD